MAQGLDAKSWNNEKSPSMEIKGLEPVKRTRGVGSRRIFPPQFKLKVLDSYRNDVDCRGNQRATARKYNIHRRQIQKWLQCEQNLRTSVEESAKNECVDNGQRSRIKTESDEEKRDLTLNQSATAFTRLGDAGRVKDSVRSPKQENKVNDVSKLEARNLKRVAQKLYPSLHGSRGEKSASDGRKFFRGLSPRPADKRDDNFNKVILRADEGPLDLKSKVRSETLPEFLPEESSPDKRSMSGDDESRGELASSKENIGGQKLSVSDAVLECLVQKYDVDGREFYTRPPENGELLCSRSEESSCLLDTRVPKDSVPYLTEGDKSEETADLASDSSDGGNVCPKKPETVQSKLLNRFDCSKSFSPKRKWMKESMQEMKEDVEHSQDTSSLPIKQRVKMNLRSLPEANYTSEDRSRANSVSSNFTIERLCSTDMGKDSEPSDCYNWRSCNLPETSLAFPPPLVLPNRVIPDLVSLHFKPEYRDGGLSPNEGLGVKEEKVSDGEDMDIDILSTTPVEKKSFDFSGYNFGKRRSFSVQFKLTVLDAFYNDKDCNKNQRATARKFNINRRQVQKWLSQESNLRSEGSIKNGKYLQRQRLGGEIREPEGCTRCPQHCLRKNVEAFDKTIEVNVKRCSDNECLSRRDKYSPDASKTPPSWGYTTDGVDFYGKAFYPSDLKTNFYQNYLFPDSNMAYHESILGWPNPSALGVPNFQYLSTWHHNLDYCQENQKIY